MRISEQQREFLGRNWYSIDAISWDGVQVIEVKTRNRYNVILPYKPKASLKSLQILLEAVNMGFKVFVATVWLEENWNYTLEVEPFDVNKLSVDRPKYYDRGGA